MEYLVGKYSKDKSLVIIDRCNMKKSERKEWVSYFFDKPVLCIHFDFDVDDCVQRVKTRKVHPNLKGERGEKIVRNMYKLFEPIDHTKYKKVITLTDDESINNLLEKWKLPCIKIDTFTKFPRTKHLLNLGSVSRDDLMIKSTEVKDFLNTPVCIEEKIDGANLGISIDSEFNIKFQNRSHYVNNKSHKQFQKLDKWKNEHASELYDILTPNLILFGEWMAYKHSIHYTNLPDVFIAFDIYDIKNQCFFSRERIQYLLNKTTIPLIHCISIENIKNVDDFIKFTNTKSVLL